MSIQDEIDHLVHCRKEDLKSYALKERNKEAEFRKTALEALQEAERAGAKAELAEMIYRYGEQIAVLGMPLPKETDDLTKPGPVNWRAELKRLQKAS